MYFYQKKKNSRNSIPKLHQYSINHKRQTLALAYSPIYLSLIILISNTFLIKYVEANPKIYSIYENPGNPDTSFYLRFRKGDLKEGKFY